MTTSNLHNNTTTHLLPSSLIISPTFGGQNKIAIDETSIWHLSLKFETVGDQKKNCH
jgi:hypothetical protein